MTDTTEPGAEDDSATTMPSAPADPPPAQERRSLWGRLNRTNRIAALILGGVGAVVTAVLIFGAGVVVGAEFGDSEGHHERAATSEYRDAEHSSGDDGGESAKEGDRQGDQAPGPTNGAPR